jgi:hypothetical protein
MSAVAIRENFTADWAFGVSGAIKNIVERAFPMELRLWPVVGAFDFEAYSVGKDHFALILKDKLSGIPSGPGELAPFPYDDHPPLPVTPETAPEWLAYVIDKFHLRNQDAAVVLPLHDCGRNDAAGDYRLFSDREKEVWNNELRFIIARQKLGVPSLTRSAPSTPSHITFNLSGTNSRVNIDSADSSVNVIDQTSPEVLHELLLAIGQHRIDRAIKEELQAAINEMKSNFGSNTFGEKYRIFMSVLADHLAVLGPIVGPFLPALANLIK